MNEQLSNKIIQWVENVGNLAETQIPSFVLEAAKYGFYFSLAEAIFLTTAFFICLSLWSFFGTQLEKPNYSDGWVIAAFCNMIVLIILPFCIFSSFRCALQAKLAPKIYVIDKYVIKK